MGHPILVQLMSSDISMKNWVYADLITLLTIYSSYMYVHYDMTNLTGVKQADTYFRKESFLITLLKSHLRIWSNTNSAEIKALFVF